MIDWSNLRSINLHSLDCAIAVCFVIALTEQEATLMILDENILIADW